MVRRKSVYVKWTLALVLVLCSSFVLSRPQDSSSPSPSFETEKSTESIIRIDNVDESKKSEATNSISSFSDTSRNVKGKAPAIGDSIKMVANQLLDKQSNKTSETPLVSDIRIPPKLKTQLAHKHKIKTRNDDGIEPEENSHAGIAVPVSLEELESDTLQVPNESSTSNEGISTWVLLSNPANSSTSTEQTTTEDKKQKPNIIKNKNTSKRPQTNKATSKRPIIGNTNKSDLIASGSAINENVYNKIKDTVLSNVQKNKNTATKTTTSNTVLMSSEPITIKKEVTTKVTTSTTPISKSKNNKKNNKNKQKLNSSSTESVIVNESAILPMEAKEQEIELEISTPATTTKKPKRTSTKKKSKTKKRKTTKPKLDTTTAAATQLKSSNKTKSTKLQKVTKKPSSTETGPFTTQIYNYLSREVMPSVGVGVIGLAGLLGIAGYFLYPFTGTPVRRTFEVDKKDDIYKHNAEEYANEGNGQPEEEMLGTVLAGMPVNSKEKYNPYAGQTTHVNSRYPVKKDQDIRYRQVTSSYGTTSKYGPKYNVHYQQKTGLAHGAIYAEHNINYNQPQYESRHSYTTEKPSHINSYTPYSAVEPIYAAPQIGPSSYSSDASSSVVYGVKPSGDTDFKPVYPYETHYHTETTNNPLTYPSTSLYLGSNNENVQSESPKYEETGPDTETDGDNKFVVGNIPKEFSDSATPAVVPEHGPRKLRNLRKKRNVVGSIEEILKAAKENRGNEIFISNEIDDGLDNPNKILSLGDNKDMYTVLPISENLKVTQSKTENLNKNELIESVSTVPINSKNNKTEFSSEIEGTTNPFKIYEVFDTMTGVPGVENSPLLLESDKLETTTHSRNINTETTTDVKSETTSTLPSSHEPDTTTKKPKPTYGPDIITYPPPSSSGLGFFDFIKRLVEFKYRLGLSILQTTSENLNRYLHSLEEPQKPLKSS